MTDMEILTLRIGKLRLKPGDVLVLQSERELSTQTWERINYVLRKTLPDHIKHIAIGPGFKLSTITPVRLAEKLAEAEG